MNIIYNNKLLAASSMNMSEGRIEQAANSRLRAETSSRKAANW